MSHVPPWCLSVIGVLIFLIMSRPWIIWKFINKSNASFLNLNNTSCIYFFASHLSPCSLSLCRVLWLLSMAASFHRRNVNAVTVKNLPNQQCRVICYAISNGHSHQLLFLPPLFLCFFLFFFPLVNASSCLVMSTLLFPFFKNPYLTFPQLVAPFFFFKQYLTIQRNKCTFD